MRLPSPSRQTLLPSIAEQTSLTRESESMDSAANVIGIGRCIAALAGGACSRVPDPRTETSLQRQKVVQPLSHRFNVNLHHTRTVLLRYDNHPSRLLVEVGRAIVVMRQRRNSCVKNLSALTGTCIQLLRRSCRRSRHLHERGVEVIQDLPIRRPSWSTTRKVPISAPRSRPQLPSGPGSSERPRRYS